MTNDSTAEDDEATLVVVGSKSPALLLLVLLEMDNRALETQRAAQEDCWLETSGLLEPAAHLSPSGSG